MPRQQPKPLHLTPQPPSLRGKGEKATPPPRFGEGAGGRGSCGRRHGFTLVELLVVMGLLLVLAALAVMIIPSISNDQRATQGATQLQQWLEIAKQRAMRDRAPRGIRLVPGSIAGQITELEYIEQ